MKRRSRLLSASHRCDPNLPRGCTQAPEGTADIQQLQIRESCGVVERCHRGLETRVHRFVAGGSRDGAASFRLQWSTKGPWKGCAQ
jgi:hypothetical protein